MKNEIKILLAEFAEEIIKINLSYERNNFSGGELMNAHENLNLLYTNKIINLLEENKVDKILFEEPILEKPPIGLIPRSIWKRNRRSEIINAMFRYSDAGKVIPTEWIDELNGDLE